MRKILLVIDMQNDFINGALGPPEAEAIVDRVVVEIGKYPAGDVIATRDTHPKSYLETQEGRSLLYAQAFQALYYSADQIHHGALPCHVHFVLDEFAAMPLPGFTRELATMRSRNISASTIIQNMAQIKELYKDSWETIPGNSDTILCLGGNESSTHEYISKALGKATIDTRTHGQTKGRSGSYSTNFQQSGRDVP